MAHLTGQIQTLQRQIQQEQETWQNHIGTKDQEIAHLKVDIQNKFRKLVTDFTQRMTVLNSEKRR